jgi:aspartyl-tRNA(Asn)/glutamyl-tRNA(Gln) amidotransferase subunit A
MAGFIESARDAAAFYAEPLAHDESGFSPEFRRMLAFGASAYSEAISAGQATMAKATARMHAVLLAADVILMPTAPQAAFAHGRAPVNQADFTSLANLAGLPALALPAGWTDDGLPVGVQLVGRAGSESALLSLAAKLDGVLNGYAPPPGYT